LSKKYVCWWSAGVTSAIATHYALEKYGHENVDIYYFVTGSEHPDNKRFIKDCENWYGKNIIQVQSIKYKNHIDVALKTRWINGPSGARCTLELKKEMRFFIEKHCHYDHQIMGFEFEPREIERAIKFKREYPDTNPVFPLIDEKLTKAECLYLLEKQGIEKPEMYKLGYHNNNCIGCFKGGMGYWNKIRKDFPEWFMKIAEMERSIGASCLKDKAGRVYLDELDPNRGRHSGEIMPECGVFCPVESVPMFKSEVEAVMGSQLSMNDIW